MNQNRSYKNSEKKKKKKKRNPIQSNRVHEFTARRKIVSKNSITTAKNAIRACLE